MVSHSRLARMLLAAAAISCSPSVGLICRKHHQTRRSRPAVPDRVQRVTWVRWHSGGSCDRHSANALTEAGVTRGRLIRAGCPIVAAPKTWPPAQAAAGSGHVCVWHFSDMPGRSHDVRSWRQNGPRGCDRRQSRRGSLNDRTPRRLGDCCQQLPMTPSRYQIL
jgi:hypothetical protein